MRTNGRRLTLLDFARYQLQIRIGSDNRFLCADKLTQQYQVDLQAGIESERIRWHVNNQQTVRRLRVNGLEDALSNEDLIQEHEPGTKTYLSASLTYSPRWYKGKCQDAIALVQAYSKPSLFITMTCNPNWPEIQNEIQRDNTELDKTFLITKVFNQKLQKLLDLLVEKNILGKVIAHCYTVEFQKRGLPHAHILLWLSTEDAPHDAETIDKIISAEIPDRDVNPELHRIITRHNIHGPCGARNPTSPCMESDANGHTCCTKKFPKPFCAQTTISDHNYPQYTRRSPANGGREAEIPFRIGEHGRTWHANNGDVVPYNAVLSLLFDCHINVECVHSSVSVKYLYKYIFKGGDQITLFIRGNDEIEQYLNARVISASEACYKIGGYKMHGIQPNVETLPCHCAGDQIMFFNNVEELQQGFNPPDTRLTEFFKLCERDTFARTLKYPEVVQYYRFVGKKWQRRKQGREDQSGNDFVTDTIGRIPTVAFTPNQAETYYLRMLLLAVPGPTSYEDLKTVSGVEHFTFQDAARAHGMLDDDTEVYTVMEETSLHHFGRHLVHTFCTLLLSCEIHDHAAFYLRFRQQLMQHWQRSPDAESRVLRLILSRISRHGYSLSDFALPEPENVAVNDGVDTTPQVIADQLNFDADDLNRRIAECEPQLNEEQRAFYEIVLNSVRSNQGRLFNLNACGGAGKTFVLQMLLCFFRSQGGIALATAISGIASTLLENGRTLHSTLAIPLDVHASSTCNVENFSARAELLRRARLLIVDEVTMGHRHIYEAINRTLQDVRNSTEVFGGLTTVFSGDWMQILPIVKHGSRGQIVDATLKKSSELWPSVTSFTLTRNMRVEQAGEDHGFSRFLKEIGSGTYPTTTIRGVEKICLPPQIVSSARNLKELCEIIYSDVTVHVTDFDWMCGRAVITGRNATVDKINDIVLQLLPGETHTYRSYDKFDGDDLEFPLEFIHAQTPAGFPPHELKLKRHAIVMLIRNVDAHGGHCNGTRYLVNNLYSRTVELVVAFGPHRGETVTLPRIPFRTDKDNPLQFTRLQFPIKPAFGITSNKSQGQTLKRVGLYLDHPFFSHGQLYVAFSRVGAWEDLQVLVENAGRTTDGIYTNNVVYTEALL